MKRTYNPRRLRLPKIGFKKVAIVLLILLVVPFFVFRPASAAIAFRNAGTGNNAGGATTLVVNAPASMVEGDIMVAIISVRGATSITGPSGWSVGGSGSSGSTINSAIYYKKATASEGSTYTWSFNASEKASGVIAAYSGVDSIYTFDATAAQVNASGTSMTTSSGTTGVNNSMVIAAYSTATGTTMTAGSSMTLRGQDASTGAGAGSRTTSGLQDIVQASAGSTGSKTMTAGAAAINIGHYVILRPKLDMKMSAYRWFANANSTTPGTALAAQDTVASTGAGSARLQMLTHIQDGMTSQHHDVKLRYAARGADNSCDASGTNETYQDIVSQTKTVPRLPATAANDTGAGSVAWSSPENATSPNIGSASITLTAQDQLSNYLKLTNFGFSVPTGATIYGVKVTSNTAATYDEAVEEMTLYTRLVKGGTIQSGNIQEVVRSSVSTNFETQGPDMFGTSLTPTDVNSSNFGVALQAEASLYTLPQTMTVGSVTVQIIYDDGGTMKFQSNASPADGAQAVNGGLTHSADPITLGSYNETNMSSLYPSAGQQTSGDILHDFSLDFSSVTPGIYCFMAYRSDNTSLGATHDVVPQITVLAPTVTQANHRFFANANSSTPGAVLAAQDTAASNVVQTPFRLRQRLAVDTGQLNASYQNYKLQYAEKSGACDVGFSGETYADVYTSITPQNGPAGTAVNDTSTGAGSTAWGSPTNATGTSNSSNASISSPLNDGAVSQWLKFTNFGFTIPTNATITDISVQIYGGSDDTSGNALGGLQESKLVKGGVISGTSSAGQLWDSGTQPSTISNSPAGWGLSLAPSDVNASNFGFAMIGFASYDNIGDLFVETYVDAINVSVQYTLPDNPILYYNNASVSNPTTISSSGNDPTNASRPTVYQSYRETDPFTNNVAAVPSGSDGLWDFSLTSSAGATGKTYCLRTVLSNGSLLDTYSQIPEITINGAGPTIEQATRGGGGVINGVKQNFSW